MCLHTSAWASSFTSKLLVLVLNTQKKPATQISAYVRDIISKLKTPYLTRAAIQALLPTATASVQRYALIDDPISSAPPPNMAPLPEMQGPVREIDK